MVVPVLPWSAQAKIDNLQQVWPGGCLYDSVITERVAGCDYSSRSLIQPTDIAVSPDGMNVYVTSDVEVGVSSRPDSLTAYKRDPESGRLSQLTQAGGCYTDRSSSTTVYGCGQAAALRDPSDVAVTPDGNYVLVTSRRQNQDAIAIFSRDRTTGALSRLSSPAPCIENYAEDGPFPEGLSGQGCIYGIRGMYGPQAIDFATSRSGKSFFIFIVSSGYGSDKYIYGAVSELKSTKTISGDRWWKYGGCIEDRSIEGEECYKADKLLRANSLVVSPDYRHIYVGSLIYSTISIIDWSDESEGFKERTEETCIVEASLPDDGSGCSKVYGIEGVSGLAMSPSGSKFYTTSYRFGLDVDRGGALAAFDRSPTGALSRKICIVSVRATPMNGCSNTGRGVEWPSALAVAKGSSDIFISSVSSGGVAAFESDGSSLPVQASGPSGCVVDPGGSYPLEGCRTAVGLRGARDIAVSQDGRHPYIVTGFNVGSLPVSRAIVVLENTSSSSGEVGHSTSSTNNVSDGGGGAGQPCVSPAAFESGFSVPRSIALKRLGRKRMLFKAGAWSSEIASSKITVRVARKDARQLRLAKSKGRRKSFTLSVRKVVTGPNSKSFKITVRKKAYKKISRALRSSRLKRKIALQVTMVSIATSDSSLKRTVKAKVKTARKAKRSKLIKEVKSRVRPVDLCQNKLSVKLKAPGRVRLSRLVKKNGKIGRGIAVKAHCSQDCTARLTVSVRNARKRRLGLRLSGRKRSYVTLAKANLQLKAGRWQATRLKITSRKIRRKIARQARHSKARWAKLRFVFKASDGTGLVRAAQSDPKLMLKK